MAKKEYKSCLFLSMDKCFSTPQLRAQAGVLKRAVLEEQNKNAALREVVRVKETNLRRSEQEVDSLGFRNKQLEHRVASLQDDLSKDTAKKSGKNAKSKDNKSASPAVNSQMPIEQSSILSEEFQKKIFECAQLTSSLADKTSEMQLQTTRIEELEHLVRSMNAEQTETEAKLRRELERLTVKTHELEGKLAEATSIVGSDDTLYVSELEQPKSNNSSNNIGNGKLDERVITLEKELLHWRTQCEVLQMKCTLANDSGNTKAIDPNKNEQDNIKNAENGRVTAAMGVGEQLLIDNYSKKIEDLLTSKHVIESQLSIYVEEVCISIHMGDLAVLYWCNFNKMFT